MDWQKKKEKTTVILLSLCLATQSKEKKYHLRFPDYKLRYDSETRFTFSIRK